MVKLKNKNMEKLSRKEAEKRIAENKKTIENLENESKELQDIIDRESNVMARVKTFADACVECGTTENEFNEKFLSLGLDADTVAYEKIKIIAKALNEGWIPDWKDGNKYYPYFNAAPFGFSATFCDHWTSTTGSGSRLCYKSRELAEYAGKQFAEIYKEMMI